MKDARRPLRSAIGWSTADRIGVWGYDLTRELIGRVNLGDMGFLEIAGRLPNARESRMFNALLVTLVEHVAIGCVRHRFPPLGFSHGELPL